MTLKDVMSKMWKDYLLISPEAPRILELFEKQGDQVINDHIALRTFQDPRLGIQSLSKIFTDNGYTVGGEYHFEQKKLYAQHFEGPDSTSPKVFISELLVDQFSPFLQEEVAKMVSSIQDEDLKKMDFCCSGRYWPVEQKTYDKLYSESEYAAWVYAFGFRPNHFTVSVNHLNSFSKLEELNAFLKEKGFRLNSSGGEIKGSEKDLLEQSSTLAPEVAVDFSEGTKNIPGCYYEFALRYEKSPGQLYQGFVSASADKIFESTNKAE